MRNMNYCRFENMLSDLEECQDLFAATKSVSEAQAACDLYRLCATIVLENELSDLEDRLDTLTRQQVEE